MEPNTGKYRISFIGAGKLAHHLATALYKESNQIVQVYSRSEKSAASLAEITQASFTTDIKELNDSSDIYFFAVPDHVLKDLTESSGLKGKLLVHTSGGADAEVFSSQSEDYGVFYPLQSFSFGRQINFREVPVLIEGSNESVRKTLSDMASMITDKIYLTNPGQRIRMHLAAVFANNFVNHMFSISGELAVNAGMSFELLKPLIYETASKTGTVAPRLAQTGPAVRNDLDTIKRHLDLLDAYPDYQKIYRFVTESIIRKSGGEK